MRYFVSVWGGRGVVADDRGGLDELALHVEPRVRRDRPARARPRQHRHRSFKGGWRISSPSLGTGANGGTWLSDRSLTPCWRRWPWRRRSASRRRAANSVLSGRSALTARYQVAAAELAETEAKLKRHAPARASGIIASELAGLEKEARWRTSKGCTAIGGAETRRSAENMPSAARSLRRRGRWTGSRTGGGFFPFFTFGISITEASRLALKHCEGR